jgi:hypothetical protein
MTHALGWLARMGEAKMQVFEVWADRETGQWIGIPREVGEIRATDFSAMADSDSIHWDTFERDGETCAIKVLWV